MSFERFTQKGRRSFTPKARIWTRGIMGLNHAAISAFSLQEVKYVVLLYEKKTGKIGLEFHTEPCESSAKVFQRSISRILTFSARAFCQYYKIPFPCPYEFSCEAREGMIVLTPIKDSVRRKG